MKFFKGRVVHNIYLAISIILFFIGFFISRYSNDKELIFGTGKVLQYSFGVLFLLLLILYILPRSVFYFWKYISIPFIIYIISYAIKAPIFGDCIMIGCDDRDSGVYLISIIFSFITLTLSIIISSVFYFIEKRNKKLEQK